MTFNSIGSDVYLCITTKDGKSSYDSRRAWDSSRLLDTLRQQYAKEGAIVAEITRQEYLEARRDHR